MKRNKDPLSVNWRFFDFVKLFAIIDIREVFRLTIKRIKEMFFKVYLINSYHILIFSIFLKIFKVLRNDLRR